MLHEGGVRKMKEYRQAKWPEPNLFELGARGRRGALLPTIEPQVSAKVGDTRLVPTELLRNGRADLPEVSEVEVVRHYTRLSEFNFCVDSGLYPLGSCTMKYNPKINEALASSPKVHMVHPYQPEETAQGSLEIMHTLSNWLSELTGMYSYSLQPSAGAHGEFTGILIIRAHHKHQGDNDRDEIIVPDSAHGTNPASAAMAGYKVIVVPSNDEGCVDVEALRAAVGPRTAGLMLTNPSTLGLFEAHISEISSIVHDAGGLLYYDGANLNAILGKARPGDMGFDVMHINLHKTFSTPHGGGGPGAGPVGVKEFLDPFLPTPIVRLDGDKYHLDYNRPLTIGKIRGFYGNFETLVRAYTYIYSMGYEGLTTASELAVLNANYLAKRISAIRGFSLEHDKETPRKHEVVITCSQLKDETSITAKDVAKRLLDFGIHSPTVYFPLIVAEALMFEPTESEPLEELDRLVDVLTEISAEAYSNPQTVKEAPSRTAVGPLDEVRASHPRTLCLSWRSHLRHMHAQD
jgi:glycine dehydrogenase subunit 2